MEVTEGFSEEGTWHTPSILVPSHWQRSFWKALSLRLERRGPLTSVLKAGVPWSGSNWEENHLLSLSFSVSPSLFLSFWFALC